MENKQIPATGFLRLKTVLEFIPISEAGWYAGVKEGRFPKPVKIGLRASAYRAEDIIALIKRLGEGNL